MPDEDDLNETDPTEDTPDQEVAELLESHELDRETAERVR